MSVVIVDYDVGNLRSVQKAFEHVGASARISRDASVIESAPAVVLPGVGAFAECVGNLERFGLTGAVRRAIESGRPFLGVCVGYQLLFEESEEFGHSRGLGVFKGKCVRFNQAGPHHKIPHMGWNQVEFTRPSRLFEGIESGAEFYFVHSYFPEPEEDITIGVTEYGDRFAAAVEHGNVFGTQFHPEKSQRAGLRALENFARLAAGR